MEMITSNKLLEEKNKEMNHVDNTEEPQVVLSLCTGYGGLDRGIERAIGNTRTAAFVEIEAVACYFLAAQMEAGMVAPAPIWTDLKTFPSKQFHGKIHGIIGGYPCQPFSAAGHRKGAEDPRHLFPHICRIISAIEPVWCLFENVSGHISLGFQEVYASLRKLGYQVEAGIFSAKEVGAPHQRKRLFILAIKNGWVEYTKSRWSREISNPISSRQRHGSARAGSISFRELGHTKYNGSFTREESRSSKKTIPNPEGRANSSSEFERANQPFELANSHGYGYRTGCETLPGEGLKIERKAQRENRKWSRDEPRNGSEKLANTCLPRYQRSEFRPSFRDKRSTTFEPITKCNQSFWPAGPGPIQYDWEEARNLSEPGLGVTIDGYNFREDLLRLLGNGVVEQTAAKAIKELIKKF